MIIIKDNAVNIFPTPKSNDLHFYEPLEFHNCMNLCRRLLDIAGKHYDLADMEGYDFWCHTKVDGEGGLGWHIDRDELIKDYISTPLCSIVWYRAVHDLQGGELIFDDGTVIVPKSNRLVMFDPMKAHMVNPYHGTRQSYNINPFNYHRLNVHREKVINS